MNTQCRVAIGMTLVLGLLAGPAMGDVSLNYLGAFKTGLSGAYNGDLAYNPAGNGGLGSLFLSKSPTSAAKEIYELTIPNLVNTTDTNALNTAVTLQSFDTGINPESLVLRSTDGKLYYSAVPGASAQNFRSINTNGTGESATSAMTWGYVGMDMTQVPDTFTPAAGKNLVGVGGLYGVCLQAIDPWNSTVTPTALVKYDNTHKMTGYDSADIFHGVEYVSVGGQNAFVISGKDNSAAAATFWFYKDSDIAGAAHSYDAQPYQIVSFQDKMFNGVSTKEIYGLAYDSTHQVIYGYEGAYAKPTYVHAWAVVPEPATMTLVILGGMILSLRRSRKN